MDKSPITPPIIVTESGDADVFESTYDAERYLEPNDVKILKAYDSEGRLLRLLPTSPQIKIEAAEWTPSHADELRQVLLKFLREVGEDADGLVDKTLKELVAIGLRYKTR